MPLSNEDSLRLNVLCAQAVRAIRINESSMVLSALTDKGEARIELTPNERHEAYLREVRGFLSEKYLGMPGGYPRHLQRWTRMGVGHTSMDKMLLLGEQEAVVALACSDKLDAKLASYAWWAYQSPEIARNMLNSQPVADSPLGPELARFLLEFLPFEARALDIVGSVKQCLQGELISEQDKAELWDRARRKNPYFVGFMLAGPQAIPLDEAAHRDHDSLLAQLSKEISDDNNPYAHVYLHFLSPEGRKWLKSLDLALKKPAEPDIVIALFVVLNQYIKLDLGEKHGVRQIQQAVDHAELLCTSDRAPLQLCRVRNKLEGRQLDQFKALLVLAQLGDNTLTDIFAGRDATGTVMRKHLKPLTDLINTTISTLLT